MGTRASSPPLSLTMETLKIMQNHYPERLAKCILVDSPFVFRVLWKVVYPLIDEVTRKKISLVRSGEQLITVLRDIADDDAVETEYGGTLHFQYDFDREELHS